MKGPFLSFLVIALLSTTAVQGRALRLRQLPPRPVTWPRRIWPARKFKADEKAILWHEYLNTPDVHPGAQGMKPGDVSTKLRHLAHYIDLNTDPFPADSNMLLAREIAQELAPSATLPPSIQGMSHEQQADMILKHVIEPRLRLPLNLDDHGPFIQIARMIATAGRGSTAEIKDVADSLDRVSILLRMWAGCLDTGKTIANGTNSGPNTKLMREQNSRYIDSTAAADPVYAAGLPAAMIIKLRESKIHARQMYSFEGVPPGTRVYDLQKLIPPASTASSS
jgi:hypothetical protein